jgi:DNA-binding beta-propeller fold protein YncE
MTAGDIYTVAGDGTGGFSGDGGPATKAGLFGPAGVTVDAAGNLLIADTGNGRTRVVAARTGTFYGKAMTAGDIYTVAGTSTQGFNGDGGPATKAKLNSPAGVAVDAAGNLLIADFRNNRVRVVAARTGTFYGQPMTAGDIYTMAGDGSPGFSGDGGPATTAELNGPFGVAVDAAGNLLITDTVNERVRVVAARTGTFYGQPMTAGDIYTVAGDGMGGFSGDGGPATSAGLDPGRVAVDAAGNLLITDTVNRRVRVVAARTGTFYGQPMTAGDIYTVAGDGTSGFSGDGGPATSAELSRPGGVAVDAAGNLLIADSDNQRIRMVAG